MRLGFLFFICFGFYWEDQEFFVGSMAKLAEKAASTIVQSMWQETHPCWRIPEKVWRNWLYPESCTGQDWIWTWCIHERKAAIAELGLCFFLLSLNSITKKTTAVHDILFVFMHMGWLAWIAVMMRLRRQIVWTVNMVQAFSAAMSISGCKHTSHRRAQIMCL